MIGRSRFDLHNLLCSDLSTAPAENGPSLLRNPDWKGLWQPRPEPPGLGSIFMRQRHNASVAFLAEAPRTAPVHVVTSRHRPGCYQPKRQLLSGVRTHKENAPFHGAPRDPGKKNLFWKRLKPGSLCTCLPPALSIKPEPISTRKDLREDRSYVEKEGEHAKKKSTHCSK